MLAMKLVLLLRKLVRRFGREGGGARSEDEEAHAQHRLARLRGERDVAAEDCGRSFCAFYDLRCYRAITYDSFVRD